MCIRDRAITIMPAALENAHPNTALITLTDAQGHTVSVQGASVGGGNILVTRVNGMAVEITGQYTCLLYTSTVRQPGCFCPKLRSAVRMVCGAGDPRCDIHSHVRAALVLFHSEKTSFRYADELLRRCV